MSAPERPSRQQLVVAPRQSHLPMLCGAAVCGCIGFGMVWALGVGRAGPPAPAPVAAEAVTAAADQWQPRDREDGETDEATRAARPPVTDPAVAPASLDAATPDALGETRPLSRFSQDAVTAEPDASGAEPPGRLSLPPVEELSPAIDMPSDASAPAAVEAPLGDAEPLDPTAGSEASPPADALATGLEDAGPGSEEMIPQAPPDESRSGSPPGAPVAEPSPPPTAPSPARFDPPQPDLPPEAATASALPVAATVPFASAPTLVPDGRPEASAAPFAAVGPHAAAPEVAGQGRPGPVQLEGVQSPQLTVEKRGPREVQVGKPVRYEVLVRNVGAAIARDVTLRDAVPFGTALVTTTPPAAPGHAAPGVPSDELVWHLGDVQPGGQARVVVELMPQSEGEIGSVASVSFRADASVRSRATKPALEIACSDPAPVLIGRDAGVTITITNPGSGIATGVVLEGFLPENVSHRSGSELEFDVGQLKPGESRTIELVLGTRGPGVHTARLAARADGGIEVQQAVRLEVTAPTLELEVDMPVRRFLQRPATCAIAMVNAGTAPARSVELAAQLPPGMKFVRANNAGWHDDRTHRVLWNLEELPPGETGTVEVVVMPVELGPQKITAAARSADGLADQVAHVCDVEGLAALVFEVADSEDPIEIEGVTDYVVRVGNQGTKAATGVRLTATLLGDLEPVEAQGPAGHRVENLTVSFEPLAKLAPAEEAVYRVRAKGRTAGDQRVQVQITSEDHPAPITKEETTRVYADR